MHWPLTETKKPEPSNKQHLVQLFYKMCSCYNQLSHLKHFGGNLNARL